MKNIKEMSDEELARLVFRLTVESSQGGTYFNEFGTVHSDNLPDEKAFVEMDVEELIYQIVDGTIDFMELAKKLKENL